MKVLVEFSNYLADKIGERKTTITLKEGSSISDLIRTLNREYAGSVEDLFFVDEGKLAVVVYVNNRYERQDYVLKDRDHVIFFMPVCGG